MELCVHYTCPGYAPTYAYFSAGRWVLMYMFETAIAFYLVCNCEAALH